MLHELRTAVRSLLKAPGFAAVTVLTLGVAIGANTAIFSVVDAVLLRPLAYSEADRIVTVAAVTRPRPGTEGGELPFSDRGYWHFVENNRTFDQFGGYAGATIQWALTSEGPPTQLNVAAMTASAFEVLGVAPQRGRLPTAEEDVAGGPQVILLSNDLWRGVFGGSPDVIGRTVELNAESWEVIGIMPPGYHFPNPDIDAWITRRLDPTSQNFGGHHIQGIARLLPDATVESATADAESLIARFGEVGYGPTWFTGVFSGEATVRTLQEQVIGDAREPLLILLGTMLFVLLIACSNVANLFLVRSEARTRDTAVRVAMGSGRGRLIRFVLTESVLLGLAGGALGVVLAWIGLEVLVSVGPPSIPRLDEIGLSGTALGYTAGLSILAGLLFGALPAFRTGTPRMLASLRDGGRSSTLGREEQRARNVLVVVQVALALVLLVGSALMVRSFQEIRSVDPGFDPEGVLTFGLSLAPARYGDSPAEMLEGITRVYDQLFEEIEGLPGVVATGGVNTLPLTGGGARLTTQVEEFPTPEDEFPPVFLIRRATPGYFEAMGIPLVEGRTFDDRDHQERLGTLIMSEGVKERFWPNSSALGKRMQTAGAPATSVGVVGDVHDTSLETEAEQFIYKPVLDSIGGGVASMSVVVRAEGDPLSLVPAIRDMVSSLDPTAPMTDIRTMNAIVGESLSRTSFTMALLVVAAFVALFLGAVGIYGVISYIVVQRTGEIGVRQALGADSGRVRKLVMGQGLKMAGLGIGLGLLAALFLGRVLSSLLYGVSAYDPLSLVGGSVLFLSVAALASAVPAARASAIPPAEALRSE